MKPAKLRERVKQYRLALRSLIVEAEHYPKAQYPYIAREHLESSLKRARRVMKGGKW